MGRTHKKIISEGERRTTRQPFRPPCWTQYLRDKNQEEGILVHGFRSISRKLLCLRDLQSRYTILHAICSSKLEIGVLRCQFGELNDLKLMGKVVAKDGDGDMPLQSAVRSGASVETVQLILNYVPGSKAIMLQSKNRSSETALELSLYLDKTDVFELLLEECIKMKLLPELTGVGKTMHHNSTILHKCIRQRRITFLRSYLKVCQKCDVKPALCITNEKGYTPWLYLLRYNAKERSLVEEIFNVLQQYNICLSSLYVDERNRETVLHRAYRNGNQALIDLVVKKDPTALEKLDRHKRKPQQRNRKLVGTEPPVLNPHEQNEAAGDTHGSRHKRHKHQPQSTGRAAPPAPVRGQCQQEQRFPDSIRNASLCHETPAAPKTTKDERTVGPATSPGTAGLEQTEPQKPVPAAIPKGRTRPPALKTCRRDSDKHLPVRDEKDRFSNSVLETRLHSQDPQWVPGLSHDSHPPKQSDPKPCGHCPHTANANPVTNSSLKPFHCYHPT